MNNSAAKVGEIFREAGTAFTKLSEMTLMLQPMDDAPPGSKWSEEEVEMLRGCVNRFAVELNKISQHIKNRTMSFLRRLLEIETGAVYDINLSAPCQQQQILQPAQQQQFTTQYLQLLQLITQPPKQQPELNYQCEQQPQTFHTLPQPRNTHMAQLDVLFPKKKKDKDADLLHFNPGIVPLTPPPNIMQEDSITQEPEPEPEFDDTEDETIKFVHSELIPRIIQMLDIDCLFSMECIKNITHDKRNVGTLHAEIPNYEYNPKPATEALNNTQTAHFTWSQAAKT